MLGSEKFDFVYRKKHWVPDFIWNLLSERAEVKITPDELLKTRSAILSGMLEEMVDEQIRASLKNKKQKSIPGFLAGNKNWRKDDENTGR